MYQSQLSKNPKICWPASTSKHNSPVKHSPPTGFEYFFYDGYEAKAGTTIQEAMDSIDASVAAYKSRITYEKYQKRKATQ